MPLKRVLKSEGLYYVLLAVGIIVSLWISMTFPVHPDEKVFLSVAQVMVEGGAPYRDIFDNKPPGIYMLLSPFVAIFGQNLTILRLIPFLGNIIIGWLLYLICRTINSKRGVIIAGLYLLISPFYQSNFILTEVPMTLCILMGTYLAVVYAKTRARKVIVWVGFWGSMAILFKQPAVTYWIVILGFLIVITVKNSSRQQIVPVLILYIFGSLIPILATLFYLWRMEIMSYAWYTVVVHNINSYKPFTIYETVKSTIPIILPLVPLWVLLFIKLKKRGITSYHDWFFLSLILVTIPFLLFRPYHHYWIPVLPFLILEVCDSISVDG